MAQPDPDDIIRVIDEESEDECTAEITRLKRKRKGFRAAFTEILNIIDRLITASTGADKRVNKSEDNKVSLLRAFEKLEKRYEKLQTLNTRILSINFDELLEAGYQESALNAYTLRIDNLQYCQIEIERPGDQVHVFYCHF